MSTTGHGNFHINLSSPNHTCPLPRTGGLILAAHSLTYGTVHGSMGTKTSISSNESPQTSDPELPSQFSPAALLTPKYLAPPSKTLQPGVYPEESNPSQLGISSTIHLLLKYSPLPIVPRGTLFNPNYSPTQTSRKPPFMVTLRHVSSIRCNSSWCRTRWL